MGSEQQLGTKYENMKGYGLHEQGCWKRAFFWLRGVFVAVCSFL